MKPLALALFPALFVSCAAPPSGSTDPARVRPLLMGTWTSHRSEGSTAIYMEKTFHPDGTANGFIDIRSGTGNTSLLLPRVPFQSRWKFDAEGDLVTYDMRSEVIGFFEPGKSTHDRILRTQPDRIDFISGETGDRFSFHRKQPKRAPTSWSL
ncbi:hypothetical protein HNR46_000602 [Haloferula luteola]|uniref:Lipocalin-like domain-containing protein n=1 Tax=Haloferula luteola TaxID=595692 RepID=A0A840V6H9_9BACT|nr:hypothetical protein [Haloferula luteola]MBB5350378.1 hypothetical protein [Haloferula luteola]